VSVLFSDIERLIENQSAGRITDPIGGRWREQQRADQVPERRVRRIRSVVGRGRRKRGRPASDATPARPGYRQNTVRLCERYIDNEAERQAAQEKIPITTTYATIIIVWRETCARTTDPRPRVRHVLSLATRYGTWSISNPVVNQSARFIGTIGLISVFEISISMNSFDHK